MTSSLVLREVGVDIPLLGRGDYNLKKRVVSKFTRGSQNVVQIRALDSIDLKLTDGARVALVGSNGSGKTTLLRVLAGTLAPTRGTFRGTGRVSSMLDGNLGIDTESSGYQNIIIKSLVLGMSRAEIATKKDEIAEFTGLGERLHHPVYTYSSGMAARLTFSIATALEPEILLLDEGIGTADAEFTARAHTRMESFMGNAGILVLASHSANLIHQFCDTAIWLDKGHIVDHGTVEDVLKRRHAHGLAAAAAATAADRPGDGNGAMQYGHGDKRENGTQWM